MTTPEDIYESDRDLETLISYALEQGYEVTFKPIDGSGEEYVLVTHESTRQQSAAYGFSMFDALSDALMGIAAKE